MARFDVFPNPGPHSKTTPYLLDVQSDLLDGLGSRMVVPLRDLDAFAKVKLPLQLTPQLSIQGKAYLLETPKMGAVPACVLKSPVAFLFDEQDKVTAALDFLFQGY